MSWKKHFPYSNVRPEQGRALDWICEQITSGNRTVVAELGTGIGKSGIAVTLAGWLAEMEKPEGYAVGATVLTSQKVLQDQYIRDFKFARDLRSSTNFDCERAGTCGETSRMRRACGPKLQYKLACSACPFREAKDEFVEAKIGVTNYSYFISEAVYAGELPPRQLLVLDEAHNVEDEVRRWATIDVTQTDVVEFKLDFPRGEGTAAINWLRDEYKAAIERKLGKVGGKLKNLISSGILSGEGVKKMAGDNDRLDKRMCQINRLLNQGGELLISRHEDRTGKRSMRFQPLEIRGLANEILYSRSTACVLMSATLLDKGVFTKSIGLDSAPYISIPSPFPPAAFGMNFRPVGKMTRDYIDDTLKDMPKAIQRILDAHPNEKGIIHTTNYKIADYIRNSLTDKRLLMQAGAADREKMLRRHLEDKTPTVLVSPSMMEGLDLRDDLGRFQIICKIPYPDMSDPVVKVKDRNWYNWRTIRSLVQAVGRGVRSEDDWTVTYILDLSFVDLLDRCSEMVPKHLITNIKVDNP